jgi:DNA-binding response OmpR family regulator
MDTLAREFSTAILVHGFDPLTKSIRETLTRRGFMVFFATTPVEGLELFQAHRPQIALAVIEMVTHAAGSLDLAGELERLQPDLPVLYLVGGNKPTARSSMETRAPDSVLATPFTERQLLGQVRALLEPGIGAREMPDAHLWRRLISSSDRLSSGTAMIYVYEAEEDALAAGHVAMLRAAHIHYAFRPTNYDAAPYAVIVHARDLQFARSLISQVSVGARVVSAAEQHGQNFIV